MLFDERPEPGSAFLVFFDERPEPGPVFLMLFDENPERIPALFHLLYAFIDLPHAFFMAADALALSGFRAALHLQDPVEYQAEADVLPDEAVGFIRGHAPFSTSSPRRFRTSLCVRPAFSVYRDPQPFYFPPLTGYQSLIRPWMVSRPNLNDQSNYPLSAKGFVEKVILARG